MAWCNGPPRPLGLSRCETRCFYRSAGRQAGTQGTQDHCEYRYRIFEARIHPNVGREWGGENGAQNRVIRYEEGPVWSPFNAVNSTPWGDEVSVRPIVAPVLKTSLSILSGRASRDSRLRAP